MASGGMIYIPSLIKIGLGIQKLLGGGGYTYRHRQQGDFISLLLLFHNKESRLKKWHEIYFFDISVAFVFHS
jgi:hypothetical protein